MRYSMLKRKSVLLILIRHQTVLTVYLGDVYSGANSTAHSATYLAYSAAIRAVCMAVTLGILVTLFADSPGP